MKKKYLYIKLLQNYSISQQSKLSKRKNSAHGNSAELLRIPWIFKKPVRYISKFRGIFLILRNSFYENKIKNSTRKLKIPSTEIPRNFPEFRVFLKKPVRYISKFRGIFLILRNGFYENKIPLKI